MRSGQPITVVFAVQRPGRQVSRTQPPDPVCPECGSPFEIEPRCRIEETYLPRHIVRGRPLPRRIRLAPVAFCTGCEFVIEIRKNNPRE